MPSVSEKQREAMAIAEHHPDKLYSKNKGLLKMSHKQLHEFAATKGLSKHKSKHKSKPKKKHWSEQ